MKSRVKRMIGVFIIACMTVIAVCNVFIYRSFADFALAAGVIWVGWVCAANLLKVDQS